MQQNQILQIFPESLRQPWRYVAKQADQVQEIRLRARKPVVIRTSQGEWFLKQDGMLTKEQGEVLCIEEKQLDMILNHICQYSIYAYGDEIRQGFLTIPGGHRIGFAGQVILEQAEQVRNMKYIRYMNIRMAHEIKGVADAVLPLLYQEGRVLNTLIISPPGCGKTTMLRDIIRNFSNGTAYGAGRNVSVVDERSEIAGSYMGVAQNDVGIRTDVLDCCSKAEGMVMLLRSMAPQVIAVDEIGNYEDIRAIEMTLNSGCKLLATVHGSSIDEIRKKPLLERLMKEHVFERYIILQKETAGKIGKVREIYDERGTCLYQRQRSVC